MLTTGDDGMAFGYYIEVGKDGYPPVWHDTLKHLVREQAGHRCVRCRHPYRCGEKRADRGEWTPCDEQCRHKGEIRYRQDGWGEFSDVWQSTIAGNLVAEAYEVYARYRILTVHHLDGDKRNCRWWNLAALCQRCHLEIQGRVKMHRPYFLEHSEWFKPYAAGFYAWTKLGEDLTREEVAARLDELLALAAYRSESPA